MLCQQCQEREANVRIMKVVNGQKQEIHLCEKCAQKAQQEFSAAFYPGMVPDFLQALFGFNPVGIEKPQEEACPHCGITFSQIRRAGKMGCSHCYEKFEPQIEPLLRQIHGGGQHVGKIPERRGVEIKGRIELKQLKDKLQALIQQEEFEEAAVIRDKIRRLEQKGRGGGNES